MKKNNKSMACPKCHEGGITRSELIKYNENEFSFDYCDSTATSHEASYYCMCKCNKCGNTYRYDFGREIYTTFDKAPIVTSPGIVKLYFEYESEFGLDYKIYSVVLDDNETFLIEIEDTEYPAAISKEQAMEFINDIKKCQGFIFSLRMGRYK